MKRETTLTRLFDAPRPLVFSLWTEARHIANWWGPHGFDCPKCEADPRPGGEIVIHMRGPDGEIYPMGGFYDEITPYSKIAFTTFVEAPDGTRLVETMNVVTFSEVGRKTRMTLQVQGTGLTEQAKFMLRGMEAGWATSLVKLVAHAAAENGNPDAADQAALFAILGDQTNAVFGQVGSLAAQHLAEDAVVFDLGGLSLFDGWQSAAWSMSDLVLQTGGDLAVAYGIGHLAGVRSDGEEVDRLLKVTIAFARRDGRWLITHQHFSA
jgi:uncharacterized protein YndB with AHSA1/START domain